MQKTKKSTFWYPFKIFLFLAFLPEIKDLRLIFRLLIDTCVQSLTINWAINKFFNLHSTWSVNLWILYRAWVKFESSYWTSQCLRYTCGCSSLSSDVNTHLVLDHLFLLDCFPECAQLIRLTRVLLNFWITLSSTFCGLVFDSWTINLSF